MTTAIISNFNALESAALHRIANDYSEHAAILIEIFNRCTVIKRLNTGGGFYSDISIDGLDQLPDGFPTVFGDAWLSIEGMKVGICCLIHLTTKIPPTFEGYSLAGENTSDIDFDKVRFRVEVGPPT
jgi:hypothetical protein